METVQITGSTQIEHETLATVGFFDGVHQGHRYLIDRMKKQAQSAGLKTTIITFPVHPRKVLQQDYQPRLLNSLEERLERLAATGIDYCYVIDFTREFSEITARDFIRQILREQLRIKELLIGYDHQFGKGRTDVYEQYAAYGQACGMIVRQAEKRPETDGHTSSTTIRRLLAGGQVREAAIALSYPYRLAGEVIHGNHLGRTIGFPTANLDLNDKDKIVPHEGVYAVDVEVESRRYKGMAYIGKRPTVASAGEQRIEVHIFDFDKDIYGEQLCLQFTDFLRPDIRFDNLEQLKEQLARDKRNASSTLVSRTGGA
ncbi:MAG: bifunctional riboflavin kinase/FAD synthetase [Dysgonamonadaceae bacterium]|jgi:riboflavin kinase/FMN adenylyltransferase|nr:bifunctional riboflavin kinase/FAD synthetase [Dysgonamonadaceae bacterium]